MTPDVRQLQKTAKKKLKDSSFKICKNYTFGWGGPLQWAIEQYPYIEENTKDIAGIIPDLPICVFITREISPNEMVAVVPYRTPDGNPTNTRVLPTCDTPQSTLQCITEFSQAFLFLLASGGLPEPQETKKLTRALEALTNKKLMKL